MTKRKTGWRRALPPLMAAAMVACGGGGGSDQAAPDQTSGSHAPAPAPTTSTMPDYLAARAQRVTILGFPSPQPAELASIFDHSRVQAVAMLQGQLGLGNAMVVPPLRYAFLNTVASAARGDTLAEVLQRHPPALGAYASASQTRGIARQVWARRGARFLPAFLAATDSFGAYPPLGSWAGGEFAEWWLDDTARRELAALHPDLPAAAADTLADTRMLVADALLDRVGWPDSKVFDGVYQTETGDRLTMPMLRLNAGVKRLLTPDFTADVARLGDRWLLAIQPRVGSLKDFSDQRRLDSAMVEAVQALSTPTLVAVPDGEIVLPVLNLKLAGNAIAGTGLGLVYDEVNADLRGLDGGGTYLKSADVATNLTIGAGGLASQAAQVATFNFSAKNRFGPGGGTSGVVTHLTDVGTIFTWPRPACPRSIADLRSFFLVVLDEQKRVMSLSAIAALAGTPCQ